MKPYYEHGGTTIYHGDCREILTGLPKVDLVLTDPPYGIGMSRGVRGGGYDGFGKRVPRNPRIYPDAWDSERPNAETLAAIIAAGTRAIVWGGNYFADLLPASTHWLVWDKLNTMPTYSDCELAWTNFANKSVKKIALEWNGILGAEEVREHPTQKPLGLMAECIFLAFPWCDESKTILDPFMGSGTTLRAAKDLGHAAIGIEIEEKYCEIAARRLQQEVFQF